MSITVLNPVDRRVLLDALRDHIQQLRGTARVNALVLASLYLGIGMPEDRTFMIVSQFTCSEPGAFIGRHSVVRDEDDEVYARLEEMVRRSFARFRCLALAGDWVRAIYTVGNRDRLPVIEALRNQRLITHEDLRRLLAEHYSNAGYAADVGKDRVLRLFRYAGFVSDTDGVRPPRRTVTAWRGARPGHGRGLSWTTDLEVARFFAQRHASSRGRGLVYVAEVPPRAVLGVFLERQESELVVDPRALRDVRILERLHQPSLTAG